MFSDWLTQLILSSDWSVYDCLVWDTGSGWRAAIDTSEEGDLVSGLNLGIYRETLEWGTLSTADQVCVINTVSGYNNSSASCFTR